MKKIGVVSSSSPVFPDFLAESVKVWVEAGYELVFSPSLFDGERFLAGDDDARAAEIHSFYADDSVCAVLEAGGGYGSQRILNLLDYDLIGAHPKPLIGLSDSTALQNALFAKAGVICPTGVLLKKRFSDYEFPSSLADWFAGRKTVFPVIGGGAAAGVAIGGCLSLVDKLVGTPYLSKIDGAILIVEDVGEEPYAVDRMLSHLELAGVYNRLNAVVFGNFTDCVAKDSRDGTVADVLNEWRDRIPCSVFSGLNYGHQRGGIVWPIGGRCAVENGVLSFEGKAV